MAVVHMTRSVPEVEHGATSIDVQDQYVSILEARGWVVSKPAKEEKKPEPVKEEVAEEKAEEKPVESSKKKNKF